MSIAKYLPDKINLITYTEDTWLSERRKGIGGSDVSVLLGMNPYKSKLKLYKEKVEGYYEDLSENVNVSKGKDLEDLIRLKYVVPYFNKMNYFVHHPDVMMINPECPHLRANLDALAVPDIYSTPEDNIVIEIKWVSEWGESAWDTEAYFGVPPHYYAQVQAYMYVTGARKAVICALFDSTWKVKFYEIPYNADFAHKMTTQIACFMTVNVGMKMAPKLDSELDKKFIPEMLTEEKELIESEEMTETIVQYNAINKQVKNLEKEKKALSDKLTNMYVDGIRPHSPIVKMKISTYNTSKFDTTKFKEAEPELYKQYVKNVECVRTTIS